MTDRQYQKSNTDELNFFSRAGKRPTHFATLTRSKHSNDAVLYLGPEPHVRSYVGDLHNWNSTVKLIYYVFLT